VKPGVRPQGTTWIPDLSHSFGSQVLQC